MLMLISRTQNKSDVQTAISIHLMLMLICKIRPKCTPVRHFNTSHVNVNHSYYVGFVQCVHISIHLMLMLISVTSGKGEMIF